jgi:hypothetical protein
MTPPKTIAEDPAGRDVEKVISDLIAEPKPPAAPFYAPSERPHLLPFID